MRNRKNRNSVENYEVAGIAIAIVSAFTLFFMIAPLGVISSTVKGFVYGFMGFLSYFYLSAAFFAGIMLVRGKKIAIKSKYVFVLSGAVLTLSAIAHLATSPSFEPEFSQYLHECYAQSNTAGGVVGGIATYPVAKYLSTVGAYIVFSIVLALLVLIFVDMRYIRGGKVQTISQQQKLASNGGDSFRDYPEGVIKKQNYQSISPELYVSNIIKGQGSSFQAKTGTSSGLSSNFSNNMSKKSAGKDEGDNRVVLEYLFGRPEDRLREVIEQNRDEAKSANPFNILPPKSNSAPFINSNAVQNNNNEQVSNLDSAFSRISGQQDRVGEGRKIVPFNPSSHESFKSAPPAQPRTNIYDGFFGKPSFLDANQPKNQNQAQQHIAPNAQYNQQGANSQGFSPNAQSPYGYNQQINNNEANSAQQGFNPYINQADSHNAFNNQQQNNQLGGQAQRQRPPLVIRDAPVKFEVIVPKLNENNKYPINPNPIISGDEESRAIVEKRRSGSMFGKQFEKNAEFSFGKNSKLADESQFDEQRQAQRNPNQNPIGDNSFNQNPIGDNTNHSQNAAFNGQIGAQNAQNNAQNAQNNAQNAHNNAQNNAQNAQNNAQNELFGAQNNGIDAYNRDVAKLNNAIAHEERFSRMLNREREEIQPRAQDILGQNPNQNVNQNDDVLLNEGAVNNEDALIAKAEEGLFSPNFSEEEIRKSQEYNPLLDVDFRVGFEGEELDKMQDHSGMYSILKDEDDISIEKQLSDFLPIKRQSKKKGGDSNQIGIFDYAAEAATKAQSKKLVSSHYIRPSTKLLEDSTEAISFSEEELRRKAELLVETLNEMKFSASVEAITPGPAFTRFELKVAPGTPLNNINKYIRNIAYSLASTAEKIRIEAPIPNKAAIGIEIPNERVSKIGLRTVLESKEFKDASSPVTISLGQDIAGKNMVADIARLPHLLIAGTTGSGKSSCLNSIITSLLFKASPEEMRLILIDPKRVEFPSYAGLPHLYIKDIIYDADIAVNALKWLIEEMDRRYLLLNRFRAKNIKDFNALEVVKSGEEPKLPYIVLVVDEFGNLIDAAGKEIEQKVRELAARARAAGIHLIFATQRPSVDVITGTIKANLPSRIAFKVSNAIDSKTIIDKSGAEKLAGVGDMLFCPADSDEPTRVQGSYVDDNEVRQVVEFIIANNTAEYDEEAYSKIFTVQSDASVKGESDADEGDKVDELLTKALWKCIESNKATATFIQRKMSIGYARAARILDQLEERKYVSKFENGNKDGRIIYITAEQFRMLFGDPEDL